jgi:mediator of RNA polymerase II transcription subunit 14
MTTAGDGGTELAFCTRILDGPLFFPWGRLSHATFANLAHSLSGYLTVLSNALILNELQYSRFLPAIDSLRVGRNLQVPCLFVGFKISNLPPAMRLLLHGEFTKKQMVKETIQISYHGFDTFDKTVIVVAEGKLRAPLKNPGFQHVKLDASVVLQPDGRSFAMRFLTTAGTAIVFDLFDRLQRLEIMLSIFQSLQRNGVQVKTFSLSRLSFEYNAERPLSATIQVHKSASTPISDLGVTSVSSHPIPLSQLHLNLSFSELNPHRRIKNHMTTILNRNGLVNGVPCVLSMLQYTLPLLHALASLDASHLRRSTSSRVQIVARDAKVYQIHYPMLKCRFLVTGKVRRDKLIWILKKQDSQDTASGELVRNQLFCSKGNGWKGLGNGAVADADSVGNLISALDTCMQNLANLPEDQGDDGPKGPESETSQVKPRAQQQTTSAQAVVSGIPQPPAQLIGQRGKDVITID